MTRRAAADTRRNFTESLLSNQGKSGGKADVIVDEQTAFACPQEAVNKMLLALLASHATRTKPPNGQEKDRKCRNSSTGFLVQLSSKISTKNECRVLQRLINSGLSFYFD